MSTYYYYVNKTKHEYFSSGDMGYGLKEYVYEQELLPLIGYLHCDYIFYDSDECKGHEPEDKEDFPLQGHWMKDDCGLVSEHDNTYDEIRQCESKHLEGIYSGPRWTNISKQLFYEYNSFIKYWNQVYEDYSEEIKERIRKDIEKMCIPIGRLGAHFE